MTTIPPSAHEFPTLPETAPSSKVHPNVKLGRNVLIDDYCIIGYPPRGMAPGELETVIGDDTHIRSHAVIYAGATIGNGCHIGHGSYIREHTRLGNDVSLGINVIIEHHCQIGNNVRLQGQAGLAEYTIVEDDAWIGPRVVTANVLHPTCKRAKDCLAGPVIRRGAIVGANVSIAPDVEIGRESLIGAGSVIIKSVPDEAIMFGNPARKVGDVRSINCPYDLMKGVSPYALKSDMPKPRIPLVDLDAQYQILKTEIRLAIDRVILNSRFINGPDVAAFEGAFAAFCGTSSAVGCSSGTDALVLALMALGIGAGDEVITTAHTFVSTAEAIMAVGARPVFVDIDPGSYNLDPRLIEAHITPVTRAIIPVHLYGHPADMPAIMAIAGRHDLRVIEDAAQAHGAEVAGRRVGQWGDLACFSFYPAKNLGAFGDAGAVVTSNEELAERLRILRDHGRDSKYEHRLLGMAGRMDTLHAAVLNVKLRHLEKWNKARRTVAGHYRRMLEGVSVILPLEAPECTDVYHLFVVRHPERDLLRKRLQEQGIDTGVHYPMPLHLQPCFAELGVQAGALPHTEQAASQVLSLPMFPELREEQIARVADALRASL